MKNYMDYESIGFTDDFMFCKILTARPDLCKELLEVILDVRIERIEYLNKQETIEILADSKGIRLDVYVEDGNNTVYDIEMQASVSVELPKRSRYYQGMIDLNMIERGESYRELKKSIVIFVCLNDPFGRGLYAYHFSNACKELPELELGDETEKVFLNASGSKGNVSKELKAFLNYLITREVADDSLVSKLDEAVQAARDSEEWRLEYMTLLHKYRDIFDDGREEGMQVGREEGMQVGREEGMQVGREEGMQIGREEGMQIGLEEGRKEGRKEGRLTQLMELVEMKKLSIEDAAEVAGMTVEEFRQRVGKYRPCK